MEELFAEILINASWAGATGLFIWKIGAPVTQHVLNRFENGAKESFNSLHGQVQTLETNHIEHLKEDIERIKESKKSLKSEFITMRREFGKELSDIKGRVIRVETVVGVNGRGKD